MILLEELSGTEDSQQKSLSNSIEYGNVNFIAADSCNKIAL